jgi:hypothetical protein
MSTTRNGPFESDESILLMIRAVSTRASLRFFQGIALMIYVLHH